MKDSDLRANCIDYCEDCRRCHTFQTRAIEWGEIAPNCVLNGLDDDAFAVPCQNDHVGPLPEMLTW